MFWPDQSVRWPERRLVTQWVPAAQKKNIQEMLQRIRTDKLMAKEKIDFILINFLL